MELKKIEYVKDFYLFLQGKLDIWKHPKISLSESKAWEVIYFLQEYKREEDPLIFPDTIERCAKCGELFDTESEGDYDAKYEFDEEGEVKRVETGLGEWLCDDCLYGE
jgi:hypothetical protein